MFASLRPSPRSVGLKVIASCGLGLEIIPHQGWQRPSCPKQGPWKMLGLKRHIVRVPGCFEVTGLMLTYQHARNPDQRRREAALDDM